MKRKNGREISLVLVTIVIDHLFNELLCWNAITCLVLSHFIMWKEPAGSDKMLKNRGRKEDETSILGLINGVMDHLAFIWYWDSSAGVMVRLFLC